jgi:hypothetical protein
MTDENKVPTAANWMLDVKNNDNNTHNYSGNIGNCPSYIHEVIGHYENNVMVYLDDISVCHSRTASDISVTK